MNDQELYDFFKNGSDSLDEMPSAGLWSSIEDNLKVQKTANPYKSITIKVMLLLITAALVTLVYFTYFNPKKAEKSIPHNIPAQKSNPEILPSKQITKVISDTVKPEKPTVKNTVKAPEEVSEYDFGQEAATPSPETEIVEPDKPAPATSEPEQITNTKTYKDRVVIRTTKKITAAEYDLLLQKALIQNENAGKMLIIIAPGYPVFRKMIPQLENTNEKTYYKGILTQKTTTNTPQKDVLFFRDTLIKNDTLALKSLKTDTSGIFTNPQVMPDFPGGMSEFYKFINKNFKASEDFEGKGAMTVTFIIEKNGKLSDIKVQRDLGFGTADEIIRVLRESPKWLPGKQDDKPVRTKYSLQVMITAAQ